jgi:hypothetical protein
LNLPNAKKRLPPASSVAKGGLQATGAINRKKAEKSPTNRKTDYKPTA